MKPKDCYVICKKSFEEIRKKLLENEEDCMKHSASDILHDLETSMLSPRVLMQYPSLTGWQGKESEMNIRLVSSTRPLGQDWLHQQWTNGERTVDVILPPKHAHNGFVFYDSSVGEKMARKMLDKPGRTSPHRPR